MRPKTCNKELVEDVMSSTGESAASIKGAVDYFSKFTATIIKTGAFETVMIPYFGKFQPKSKEIQFKMHRRGLPWPEQAKLNTDAEPIHDHRGLPGGDQQRVDPADTSVCEHPEG